MGFITFTLAAQRSGWGGVGWKRWEDEIDEEDDDEEDEEEEAEVKDVDRRRGRDKWRSQFIWACLSVLISPIFFPPLPPSRLILTHCTPLYFIDKRTQWLRRPWYGFVLSLVYLKELCQVINALYVVKFHFSIMTALRIVFNTGNAFGSLKVILGF